MARYFGVPLRNGLPIGLGSVMAMGNPRGAPAPIPDPYFEYTTLLLPGNGTNGAQNNTFLDSSTNAFSITRNGNTTQGTFSPFSQTGWGNFFDGTGDSLTFTANSTTSFTGDMTLEGWVFFRSFAGSSFNECCFASLRSSVIAGTQFDFGRTGGTYGAGNILWWHNGAVVCQGTAGDVPLNQWVHVAWVRSGTNTNNCKIYVNGVQKAQGTNTTTMGISSGTAYIGNSAFDQPVDGYISNLRLTNTAVYTAAFTPPTASLTAITGTSLLTCQANRFLDASSNNFTITRNGDVSVQAFSPFNPTAAWSAATNGGSGYFDGSGDYLNVGSSGAFGLDTADFTIETWIYPTANPANGPGTIFDLRTSPSATACASRVDSSFNLRFYDGPANTEFNVGIVQLNTWTHIAYVRASGSLRTYINGTLSNTTALGNNLGANQPCMIGNNQTAGYSWNGYISSFRVVKGTAVYTTGFTPPTAPLTAITNTSLLCNFTNAGIYDATSKNDLETVGNAQISTTQSKFGGSSIAIIGNSSNRVKPPASQNFAFGTGDFTVEAWIYITDLTTENFVFDTRSSVSTSGMGFSIEPNTGKLRYSGNANNVLTSSAVSANTWTHVAWCRYGGTLRGFINGILGGTAANTDNLTQTNGEVGNVPFSNVTTNMYLDDIRVTKGIARYTSNFTPPTTAFPLL